MAALRDIGFFDFSDRTKLRITGSDRVRYLNGQATNDVRKASEQQTIEACVLNAKGKMNGHIFISTTSDSFVVDADAEQRESLPTRLERYVIADDVQIEDISDQYAIIHVLSSEPPQVEGNVRIASVRRFLESGWDIWIESARRELLIKELSAKFEFFDEKKAETLRIQEGIPRWGRELTEEIIPIEANLESRTVDYEKGCYIGQEVISRIKMSGQTNKRLVKFDGQTEVVPGMRLISGNKEVGWVTSALKEAALGYVKRGFNSVGNQLVAIDAARPDSAHLPVRIVALPPE